MEHPEEPGRPVGETSGTPADRPADPYAERWAGIVRALALQDPRWVRRVSAPAPGGLGVADLMVVAGVVATLVLGVVPLALGVHADVVPLLVVGVVGCLVLPAGAPLAVRAILRRVRPLKP